MTRRTHYHVPLGQTKGKGVIMRLFLKVYSEATQSSVQSVGVRPKSLKSSAWWSFTDPATKSNVTGRIMARHYETVDHPLLSSNLQVPQASLPLPSPNKNFEAGQTLHLALIPLAFHFFSLLALIIRRSQSLSRAPKQPCSRQATRTRSVELQGQRPGADSDLLKPRSRTAGPHAETSQRSTGLGSLVEMVGLASGGIESHPAMATGTGKPVVAVGLCVASGNAMHDMARDYVRTYILCSCSAMGPARH